MGIASVVFSIAGITAGIVFIVIEAVNYDPDHKYYYKVW